MHQPDPKLLMERIDTILDILVAGDNRSAIHNLEILKAELLAASQDPDSLCTSNAPRQPWEI